MAVDPLRNMQNVWQEQPLAPARVSLAEVRRRAQALETSIKWRNVREYAASVFVALIFSYYLWRFRTPLVRLGSLLSIAGALFGMYQMRKRGSARSLPAEAALNSCLAFYRRELERQRDLLRNVWPWFLAPLVPGLGLFLAGLAIEQLHGRWLPVAAIGVVCALAFAWVVKINRAAVRALDRQIGQLSDVAKEA